MDTLKSSLTIVWFRRDLRLKDNPALFEAARLGPILPLYIYSPEEEGLGAAGAASRWWLHHSLTALEAALLAKGLALTFRQGPAKKVLLQVARELGADRVHWNRLYEPATLARDKAVKLALQDAGLQAHSFNASLLREPWELATQQGKPYQVFTPFFRALLAQGPSRPSLGLPLKWLAPKVVPKSVPLKALSLLPTLPWDESFYKTWKVGEDQAVKELKSFLAGGVGQYQAGRDQPALKGGTSLLSPRLHFGELSPHQVWNAALATSAAEPALATGALGFNRELAWREFSHHLLFHFPNTVTEPLRPTFKAFPWQRRPALLKAWQQGCTGFPIVDAGMRQLWQTGFMHNRVRMIAASILIKDFLVDWREGAAWFMDTLVDADLAQNTMGWQWTAGCGADASPFFRIFNPTLQGERFDPLGTYVRRWVPELARMPDKFIHKPWLGPSEYLGNYPLPLVDHSVARDRALDLFKALKTKV